MRIVALNATVNKTHKINDTLIGPQENMFIVTLANIFHFYNHRQTEE